MSEGEIRQLAQMYALVAEMNVIMVSIEGMKAQNEYRKCRDESPEYIHNDFIIEAEKLDKIAFFLRDRI